MSGYGASSFFRDNLETPLNTYSHSLDDRTVDNELRNACREIRLIPAKGTDAGAPQPAWSRLGFSISHDTKAAYESSSDLDARRNAGLGISMRFPSSRTALWDPQPISPSTHLTHVLCIPSFVFIPSLVKSIHQYLTECGRFDEEWELIGRYVTTDHQLASKESVTRGNGQIVFERFQKKHDRFHVLASQSGSSHDFRAACLSLDVLESSIEPNCDLNDSLAKSSESPFMRNVRKLPILDASKRPKVSSSGQRKCAEQRILERTKGRGSVIPAKFLSFAVGFAIDDAHLIIAGEVTAPCESYVVTPLKLLKVIPTVLAQSLYDRDPAYSRGCSGFLSMDQTRRLLVLTEEDPKVAQLPLVGIWVSGVESINSPFVWACLLRYRNCQGLGERVTQQGSFLLLCYQQSAIMYPPWLAQVSLQSGLGMFAHHASTRVLKAFVQYNPEQLSAGTTRSDILDAGMRLDFGLENVEYSYNSKPDSFDIESLGLEDFHSESGTAPDLNRKDFHMDTYFRPSPLHVTSHITVTDNGKSPPAQVDDLQTLECDLWKSNPAWDVASCGAAEDSGFMPRLQAPRPCLQKATDVYQCASNLGCFASSCETPLDGKGLISLQKLNVKENTENENTAGGVNFMLAAHVRSGVSPSLWPRYGTDSNPRAATVGFSQKDFVGQVWKGENVSSSKDWNATCNTADAAPCVGFDDLNSLEYSLSTRPFSIPLNRPNGNDKHRHISRLDRSAVLEQQLAEQQRQIEELQAALYRVQTRVVHSPSRSEGDCRKTGERDDYYLTSIDLVGKKDKVLAKHRYADVQTQLSVATNGSFFQASNEEISAGAADGHRGDTVTEALDSEACSESGSLSKYHDSRGWSSRPPTCDTESMTSVRRGTTAHLAVVGGGTRPGCCNGNMATNIFPEEVVGPNEASVYEALNMSFPGARTHSMFKVVAKPGVRLSREDEQRIIRENDQAIAAAREECKEVAAKCDEQRSRDGGVGPSECFEQSESTQRTDEELASEESIPLKSRVIPSVASHETQSTDNAVARTQCSRVQEKVEPNDCSKSAASSGSGSPSEPSKQSSTPLSSTSSASSDASPRVSPGGSKSGSRPLMTDPFSPIVSPRVSLAGGILACVTHGGRPVSGSAAGKYECLAADPHHGEAEAVSGGRGNLAPTPPSESSNAWPGYVETGRKQVHEQRGAGLLSGIETSSKLGTRWGGGSGWGDRSIVVERIRFNSLAHQEDDDPCDDNLATDAGQTLPMAT